MTNIPKTNIRSIPVTDVNGAFLYNKYEVTGDDTNDVFSSYYTRSAGVTIDLSYTPGDDTFHGGRGNDTIDGGAGSDLLYGDKGNDVFVQKDFAGNDTIVGGAGMDTADYSQAQDAGSSITVDITSGSVLKYQEGVVLGTDDVWGLEKIVGTGFDDVMQGGIMWNLDTHYLSFTLDGGAGVDTLSYRNGEGKAGSINLNLGSGTVVKYAGGAEVGRDKVSNFEHVIGSRQNDTLIGSKRDDVLDGNSGNDIINAGAGNDVLHGGSGEDVLSGEDGNDRFLQDVLRENDTLDGGKGFDIVDYSQTGDTGMRIFADLADLADLASGTVGKVAGNYIVSMDTVRNFEGLTGSLQNDWINGSAKADSLSGAPGDDSLSGNADIDTLVGGTGNDVLNGGAGNDVILGGDGNDTIVQDMNGGIDNIDGGAGDDIVDFSNSSVGIEGSFYNTFQMANVETIIGSRFIDAIDDISDWHIGTNSVFFGNDGDDQFNSRGGNDTFNGGSGDDVFIGGPGSGVFMQEDGFGNDYFDAHDGPGTFDYSRLKGAGITVNATGWNTYIDKRYIEGPSGTGQDKAIMVRSYIGTRYNDVFHNNSESQMNFSGGDGEDVLRGGGAGDTLSGGSGNDLVVGGIGNDRIVQESLSGDDNIDGGGGNDTLDYSQTTPAGVRIDFDLTHGTATKYRDGVLLGIDIFRNIEHFIDQNGIAVPVATDHAVAAAATGDAEPVMLELIASAPTSPVG